MSTTETVTHPPSSSTTTTTNNNKLITPRELHKTSSLVINRLVTPVSHIEYGELQFIIFDSPRQETLHLYLNEMRRYHTQHWVRCCETISYNINEIESSSNMICHNFSFDDGKGPSMTILNLWLKLLENTFIHHSRHDTTSVSSSSSSSSNMKPCIAIHCVAGLGRAPLLVAIALMEYGLNSIEAVQIVRNARRGALNSHQLHYLQNYTPRGLRKTAHDRCILM